MSVTEKLEKLKEAEAIYEKAQISAKMARSEETRALNRLNDAQRAFDAEVEAVKKKSPGGDWQDERRHRKALPAAMSEGREG